MVKNTEAHRKGVFIVMLGPDGSGKSTLVLCASKQLGRFFKEYWHFHWRPNLLPKLSRTSHEPDFEIAHKPPGKAAYGKVISFMRYIYYLLDFIVGYWVLIWPRRKRGCLIIGERWYYDVIANPVRYGFALPDWLLRLGGYLVPKPDMTLLLEADPQAIHDRKPELTIEEISLQINRLGNLVLPPPAGTRIWTGDDVEESVERLVQTIVTFPMKLPE